MQYGVLHHQIKNFDGKLSHSGLDIVVASRARHKKALDLELCDFDLLNRNHVILIPEFPVAPISELFDNVVCKYIEHPRLEEMSQKLEKESKEEKTVTLPVNGKIIKAVRKIGNDHQIITHDMNPSEELNKLVNSIIQVKGGADMKLKEQLMLCADKLRVGTLDIGKDKTLWRHTESKVEKVTGHITHKVLIKTIWFISKMYMQSPSFRKYLTISVTQGNYTCGYQNGEPFFNTKGLTQTEIDIINDLKLIKE
jgi:hypothetical protein